MPVKHITILSRVCLIPVGRAYRVLFTLAIFFTIACNILLMIKFVKVSVTVPIQTTPLQMQEIDFRLVFLNSTTEDILNMKPPKFLPNLTNPCFYNWEKPKYGSKHKRRKPVRVVRCLPYFMLIGQPKCGSTDIFYRITHHPDVARPRGKEPHWWTRLRHGAVWVKYARQSSLKYYLDFFNSKAITESAKQAYPPQPQKITGEGSASTLWDHNWWWKYHVNKMDEEPKLLNAQYIHYFLPNVKLIIILRNPVNRMYSEYLYAMKSNESTQMFHKLAKQSIDSFRDCFSSHSFRSCAYKGIDGGLRLNVGFYAFYIKEWLRFFPREQFLFIQMEDYSKHINTTMDKVYEFLNLRRDWKGKRNRISVKNARNSHDKKIGDMMEETREMLTDFYKPFNEELANLLSDDLFLWTNNKDDR